MDVLTTKFIVLILLVVLRVGSGIVPIFISKRYFGESNSALYKKQIELAVACCLSFASGVLLATCFVHFSPETRDILSHSMPSHKLPVTELLICAGFFLIFFIDEAILTFSGQNAQINPILGDETSLSISSKQLDTSPSGPRRLFLALGLSCHSVIEGLALGFAETSANVWFLFVATSVHECIILFSISLHMMASEAKVAHVLLFIIVSSLVLPTGMLLGILSSGSGDSIAVAIIQGLAAGTILYVIFYEVLTRDVRVACTGLLSFLFAIFGFLIMLAVQLMGVYNHGLVDGPTCLGMALQETQGSDYEEYKNSSK